MSTAVFNKFNRAYQIISTPAQLASDFLAIELSSGHSNPICVDSLNFGTIPASADASNFARIECRIAKQLKLDPTAPGAAQLANFSGDLLFYYSSNQQQNHLPFFKKIILEPGYFYTIVVPAPTFSTAPANNVTTFLTVLGRYLPQYKIEDSPFRIRTGIGDECPPPQHNAIFNTGDLIQ